MGTYRRNYRWQMLYCAVLDLSTRLQGEPSSEAYEETARGHQKFAVPWTDMTDLLLKSTGNWKSLDKLLFISNENTSWSFYFRYFDTDSLILNLLLSKLQEFMHNPHTCHCAYVRRIWYLNHAQTLRLPKHTHFQISWIKSSESIENEHLEIINQMFSIPL